MAAELDRALARRARHGEAGATAGRLLARGDGWSVRDVVCTSGPADRPFEELHTEVSIAIVAAGTFQYRSPSGRALMTPGSLLLGNAGHCFECGHEHGVGDRCIAFAYSSEYFERIAADVGASPGALAFRSPRGGGSTRPRVVEGHRRRVRERLRRRLQLQPRVPRGVRRQPADLPRRRGLAAST
jgi:hypothetical protein